MVAKHLVVNFILVKDSHVLLKKERNSDNWEFPGGHLQSGESPIDAVEREVKEELGVSIQVVSDAPMFDPKPNIFSLPAPLNMYSHEVSEDSALNEPHFNVGMTFVVITKEEPQPLEGQHIKWFTKKELKASKQIVGPIKTLSLMALEICKSEIERSNNPK